MNPVPSRPRLVGFALLAATFLVGALSGAAVDRVVTAAEPDARRRGDDGRDRDHRSYVIDAVEMDARQRAAIDSILERRSERMRAVWQEVEPRLDAITDSARAEIMSVLTPEQRAEYERKLEERRARRQESRDGHEDGAAAKPEQQRDGEAADVRPGSGSK